MGGTVSVGSRGARRRLGAAVAMLLAALVATPFVRPAAAGTPVNVTVTILRFIQIQNPDPGPLQGCCGDPYARVRIGPNPFQDGPHADSDDDKADVSPYWTFTQSVDSDLGSVPVTIQILDHDTGLASPDDIMDLNPINGVVELNLSVNLATGAWSGDVPLNTGFAQGDGDHEEFGFTEGGEAGAVLFDVSLSNDGDLDDDGIPDGVERFGVRDANGNLVADMASLGADPCRKTVAVEVDFMGGAPDGHSHQPDPAAIAEAVAAFNAAPVAAVGSCPYAGFPTQPSGVNLVVDVSNQVPEQAVLTLGPAFEAVKSANFNAGRAPYFHYNLWVHDRAAGSSSSGLCCTGKDYLVSLGSWGANQNGTVRQQSGTFIHELGHDLGLGHGGGDGVNFKPNYLSVMSYLFQTAGLTNADTATSAIDYSRADLNDLNELSLAESAGIGDGPLMTAWTDLALSTQTGRGDGPLDWDGDGTIDGAPVAVDVNNDGGCVSAGTDGTLDTTTPAGDDVVVGGVVRDGPDRTCQTAAVGDDSQDRAVGDVQTAVLTGFDDWSNIQYRAAMSPTAGGVNVLFDEITYEQAQQVEALWAGVAGSCPAGTPTIVGTAGADTIVGTPGPDVIHGLGGNDSIAGLGGDDRICGGPGDDRLSGGAGDDELYGGDGNDRLVGEDANDKLSGGLGNDELTGGNGDDDLSDRIGIDRLAGSAGDDVLDTKDSSAGDSVDGGPHVVADTCKADATEALPSCP